VEAAITAQMRSFPNSAGLARESATPGFYHAVSRV
jgi:hypothetical protein